MQKVTLEQRANIAPSRVLQSFDVLLTMLENINAYYAVLMALFTRLGDICFAEVTFDRLDSVSKRATARCWSCLNLRHFMTKSLDFFPHTPWAVSVPGTSPFYLKPLCILVYLELEDILKRLGVKYTNNRGDFTSFATMKQELITAIKQRSARGVDLIITKCLYNWGLRCPRPLVPRTM